MKAMIYVIKKTIVSKDNSLKRESLEGVFQYDEHEKACEKIGMLFFDLIDALPYVTLYSFDETNNSAIIRTGKDTYYLSLIGKVIEL